MAPKTTDVMERFNARDRKLILIAFKHMTGMPQVNWDLVAPEFGVKSTQVARDKFEALMEQAHANLPSIGTPVNDEDDGDDGDPAATSSQMASTGVAKTPIVGKEAFTEAPESPSAGKGKAPAGGLNTIIKRKAMTENASGSKGAPKKRVKKHEVDDDPTTDTVKSHPQPSEEVIKERPDPMKIATLTQLPEPQAPERKTPGPYSAGDDEEGLF